MPSLNNRNIILGVGAVIALGFQSVSLATPINHNTSWDGPNHHLYQLMGFNDPTQLESHQVMEDETWSISSSGGSVNTLMFEIAGYRNRNTFGIYDLLNPNNRVQIFEGNDSPGGLLNGSQRTLSISDTGLVSVLGFDNDDPIYMATGQFSGNMFGYYLDGPGGTFFSQQSLNRDGVDHMVTFQGDGFTNLQVDGFAAGAWTSNEFVLAWEDLNANHWDWDYNDFVVMVESVMPHRTGEVPLPATLSIFGLGLGLLATRKRRV